MTTAPVFDADFEDDILGQCLVDADYLKGCLDLVKAHHFLSKQHAWLWEVIYGTWTAHAEKATPRTVLAAAKRDFPAEDDRTPYLELASRLFKKKPESPKAALSELEAFVQFATLQATMEKTQALMEKGDIKKALELVKTFASKPHGRVVATEVKWIEEFQARQIERKHRREHPDEYVCIPTAIKRLDTIMGGLQLGELGLVVGTTGRGKSIFLVHLGYAAICRGYSVRHYTLEMPARQIAQRYDSRFTGNLYKSFKEYDFTAADLRIIDEKVKFNEERFKDKLRIVSMPIGSCDIDVLRRDLNGAGDSKRPSLVIVDSGDHMKSIRHYNDKRNETAEVYWQLKDMAEADGVAVWSSTHAGRDYADKIAGAESVSESYDKARIADAVVTLNAPTVGVTGGRAARVVVSDDDGPPKPGGEPAGASTLKLYLAKYRDGESKIHIPLATDFSRMLMREAEEVDDGV